MLRKFSTRRIVTFFLIDCLGTLAILFLAALLRAQLGHLPEPLAQLLQSLHIPGGWIWPVVAPGDTLSPQVFILVALIWPFFFIVFSVYDGRRNETLKAELLNVSLAICVSTMSLAGILYFTYRETSRILFVIFFVLDIVLLLSSRLLLGIYRHRQVGRRTPLRRPMLIIGAGPVGQKVAGELKKYAQANINLVGYVDDDCARLGEMIAGIPVLGQTDQIPSIVATYHVQETVVALPLWAHEQLVEICKTLQTLAVHVHVIPDLFALSFPSATLDGFGGIPVIDLGQPGIYGWRRFLKRAFDTVAISLGIILISPLLVLIAILIKLDSPGPVFFRQQRIGENGRAFTMVKFRSMKTENDASAHRQHVAKLIQENLSAEQMGDKSLKLEDDPRITRVGKFIRKTSLDELPQLFNVLRGEMSLVGPRPPLPYEVELYQDWHKRRLEAIPGITGLWQVAGRNRVSFDEMVRMDLEYIEHQSLWLDIKILLQTPLAVISGRGAG
jgi:exopolysaccharide biosynthesis polyprenyl glycosylphosphotransferase